MPPTTEQLKVLKELSIDLREFAGSQVQRIAFPFDALHFYREFVSQNRPCIITGATESWQASDRWTASFLSDRLGNTKIPVAVTPNGRADAVTQMPGSSDPVFALPAEVMMTMSAFLEHLTVQQSSTKNVLYIQQQNDCLRREFAPLLGDIDPEPAWAADLFGAGAAAVNIWIGQGSDSETSFHKDHYENIFTVITGAKVFTLLPPADVYRLALQEVQVAQYVAADDNLASCPLELRIKEPAESVRWSPINPNAEQYEECEHPLFFDRTLPEPLKVTVQAGEILYMPSLWYHYVEQTPGPEGLCISMNWWYEMAFGHLFSMHSMIEKLAK